MSNSLEIQAAIERIHAAATRLDEASRALAKDTLELSLRLKASLERVETGQIPCGEDKR